MPENIHELDHCLCSLLERLNIRFCYRSALLDIIQERVRVAHEAEDGTERSSSVEIVVHRFSERIFHVRNERCNRDRSCKRARMGIRGIGRMAASCLRLRLLC